MVIQLRPEHVARVIDCVRSQRRGDDISLEAMMRLAEVMAESFQSAVESVDGIVCTELGDMTREIAAMKAEVSALRIGDMRHQRIPEAGHELDAIVEATEEATNAIMSAAEEIMGADAEDPAAYRAVVETKIVEIFEACSFQDLTGQRISRVVGTLNHLDARITTLVERLKLLQLEEGDGGPETAEERRRRELILHGPQAKGEGVSQDDIDALMR